VKCLLTRPGTSGLCTGSTNRSSRFRRKPLNIMTAASVIPVARKEASKGDAASAVVATAVGATPRVITDDDELLRYGVVRVPLCSAVRGIHDDDDESSSYTMQHDDDNKGYPDAEHHAPMILDLAYWATELAQVTPAILADQGDGEYAFYRNILQEKPPLDFPFDDILRKSQVGAAMKRHFNISTIASHLDENHHDVDDIRLDDAFCVHYNTLQQDSSGARHMDPCDITVNICLQASDDMQGSQVQFHGKQAVLSNVAATPTLNCPADTSQDNKAKDTTKEVEEEKDDESAADADGFSFLVQQIPGTATIHWGHHPHQTLPITAGTRTNVVMTYCYSDTTSRGVRSDATTRTCHGQY
jgi:hypothetical protein